MISGRGGGGGQWISLKNKQAVDCIAGPMIMSNVSHAEKYCYAVATHVFVMHVTVKVLL